MSEIRLPSLGAEMDEGTLLEWYVKPGDEIKYGQVIALLDTEKAEIEMEAYDSGTIERLLIEPGQTVSVGTPVAMLVSSGSAEEPAPTPPPAAEPPRELPAQSAGESAGAAASDLLPASDRKQKRREPPRPTDAARVRATPLARRLAAERGIDLADISGSGPHGAIIETDIPSSSSDVVRPAVSSRAGRRREIIAAAMARSKREIPHYYLATTIEVENAIAWLSVLNGSRSASDRVTLSALFIRSVARAARKFPELNGHWREDGFHASSSVDLGMVVSLRDGGLVVPTIRNADERSLTELMAELRDIVGRARAGRLRSGELSDATITVTSLGDDGVESIFGVIYPPQVAIVGFGGIHSVVRSEGSLHGNRPVVRASLAADHRASDGQRGSRFLQSISQSLCNPEQS